MSDSLLATAVGSSFGNFAHPVTTMSGDSVQLAIYDVAGECVLRTELTDQLTRLDEIRLEPGDHLRCFRPSTCLEARGTYSHRHSKLLAELPERPRLDDVLRTQVAEFDPIPAAVGLPRFEFGAQ